MNYKKKYNLTNHCTYTIISFSYDTYTFHNITNQPKNNFSHHLIHPYKHKKISTTKLLPKLHETSKYTNVAKLTSNKRDPHSHK